MTISKAFSYSQSTPPTRNPAQAATGALWAQIKRRSRRLLEPLLAEAACDDPAFQFCRRDWADLPPHHPETPE